ncbi:MFS transporter [Rarobacter incanus]
MKVAAATFAVAWGGNEFTPLLVMYKSDEGLTTATVDILLAAYVLGIIPALLLGGPLSDRYGRAPLLRPAPLIAIAGSLVLAGGGGNASVLFVGRVLSGIALGLVMAVGTAWIKELSQAPFEPGAKPGAGARRAGLALTTGFGLGAGAAAAMAQFAPRGDVYPYLVNAVISLLAWLWLLQAPETRAPHTGGRLADDLKIPSSRHRRFLLVVLPAAPWVFGCAASAYAIMPTLVANQVGDMRIGFSGLLCLIALGSGFGIQLIGSRFDSDRSARGTGVALTVTVVAMIVAATAAGNSSLKWAIGAAAILGVAYGLLLVAGLQEIQRIAGPDDLAGLTAVYYSLTYLGFFIPAVLAGLDIWFSYSQMFAAGAVIAALSLGFVSLWWRKHLPSHAGGDEAPVTRESAAASAGASR